MKKVSSIMHNGLQNVVPIGKRCPSCKETKGRAEFYSVKPNGLSSYCKACIREIRRVRYHSPEGNAKEAEKRKQPEYVSYHSRAAFRSKVKTFYGITFEDAKEILRRQFGLCANRGCGKPLSFEVHGRQPNRAIIDHCHRSGKVRGIVCRRCNAVAGLIESDENAYLGVLEYIASHK